MSMMHSDLFIGILCFPDECIYIYIYIWYQIVSSVPFSNLEIGN